jgi:hypothetical protein
MGLDRRHVPGLAVLLAGTATEAGAIGTLFEGLTVRGENRVVVDAGADAAAASAWLADRRAKVAAEIARREPLATAAERARVAAASAAERAECEARYAAACATASAAGAPAPFRGPAADSPLGERFLKVIALVSASGFALDARPARFVCGLTFRLGTRRVDGSFDRADFLGSTADSIDCALRLQAPWFEAARIAPRKRNPMQCHSIGSIERTTSLIRAADAGDERHVRALLAAGAPLRCVDDYWRRTALHWASLRGEARAVAALLGADAVGDTVDALDRKGYNALYLASFHGHDGAVRALLARGARQDRQNSSCMTALHWAAEFGHAGVVELLCAAPGAASTIALPDKFGRTPLALAVAQGHAACAAVLRAHGAL